MAKDLSRQAYWIANRRIVFFLLTIWFVASYGCAIIWADELDEIRIGGFGLGFWMGHQGAMWIFLGLVYVYVFLMNRLDREYDVHED
jgi:putative solute:sodium symporter small subunit